MENSETLVIKVLEQNGILAAVMMAKCQENSDEVIRHLSCCYIIRREEIQVQSVKDVFRTLFKQLNGYNQDQWEGKIFYFNPGEFIRYPLATIKRMISQIEDSKAKEISRDQLISQPEESKETSKDQLIFKLVSMINKMQVRMDLMEKKIDWLNRKR